MAADTDTVGQVFHEYDPGGRTEWWTLPFIILQNFLDADKQGGGDKKKKANPDYSGSASNDSIVSLNSLICSGLPE